MIKYQKQPNGKTCGQTCVAMIAGIPVEESINLHGHDKGTNMNDSRRILKKLGVETGEIVKLDNRKKWELPDFAGVRIVAVGRKWGHFITYYKGQFFDPFYGVFDSKESLLEHYEKRRGKWRFSHYFEVLK